MPRLHKEAVATLRDGATARVGDIILVEQPSAKAGGVITAVLGGRRSGKKRGVS